MKVRDFGRDRNLLCSPTTHLDGSWEAALSPGDATWDSFSSVGGFIVFTGILWQLTIQLKKAPVPSKHQNVSGKTIHKNQFHSKPCLLAGTKMPLYFTGGGRVFVQSL